MAKRLREANTNEQDMKEVISRLDHQDKALDQIMILIKGSNAYNTEGLMPALKRIENDVQEIKKWKDHTINMQGKIDINKFFTKLGTIGRGLVWVGGIGGGTYGIFEILKRLLEQ